MYGRKNTFGDQERDGGVADPGADGDSGRNAAQGSRRYEAVAKEGGGEDERLDDSRYMELFLSAKRTEGCSKRTVDYYRSVLEAFEKGVECDIRLVQFLLGHTKIDTTLRYAMVRQNNVRAAHRKYMC